MEPRGLSTHPLVTIGIPTYNRPQGLARTLRQIANQSYKNLEIIISDNCSQKESDVLDVVRPFLTNDTRVKFFRQSYNIGMFDNFKFVLEKASGDYFMWAADDDEWDLHYIEQCLKNIGDSGSVFTEYRIVYRKVGQTIYGRLPDVSGHTNFLNAYNFINDMQPSLFYGLHRRDTIVDFLYDDAFDWYDCYFVLRQIIRYKFSFVKGYCGYTAGIDASQYEVKLLGGNSLRYEPFLKYTIRMIYNTEKLSILQKLILIDSIMRFTCKAILAFENKKSSKYIVVKIGYSLYSSIIRPFVRSIHYFYK